MLCEELVSHRLFVELEGWINQQAMPERLIIRGEQRTGGDANTSPKMSVNSLTPLTIIPESLAFRSFTDRNAVSGFRWFFACQ
jgi:hypothetical protein